MPFSAKTEYGLVALIDLAAAHASGELVQTGEICRRHGIPERYLEQMLTALRKGGYLQSIRGPRGGFRLARSPERITLAEVEVCLDGEPGTARQGNRRSAEFRALETIARQAQQARMAVLKSTTLAQLLLERDSLRPPEPMFYI
jgi:Rrf2 family transcriptional regulator, cysteine metabolism repressor